MWPWLLACVGVSQRVLSNMGAERLNFVEFTVDSEDRFAALCAVFAALKHDKDAGVFRDDADWLEFFDDEALSHFWWPTPAERAAHMTRWQSASPEQRLSDATFSPPAWDFSALFEAFENGEYTLVSCRRVGADRARLEFATHSYPYGGTGCMHALIEVFGFRVVAEDDGTGYYEYTPPDV